MRRLVPTLGALLLALVAFPTTLRAQPRCEEPGSITDAAQLYECGTRAINDERYVEAEAYLSRSLELQASVRTAFNLAITLRNLGRARRALTLLRELEAGRYGEVPAERRASLARQIETNLASLATVVVALPAGVAHARVEMDGVESQDAEAGAEVRFIVEPGEHAVLATAEGACMERSVLSVSRGQTQSVRLAAAECASASRVGTGTDLGAGTGTGMGTGTGETGSDDGVSIGIGIGIGVAIVAGAIALGIVLGSGTDAPACTGGAPCIETLVEPLMRF